MFERCGKRINIRLLSVVVIILAMIMPRVAEAQESIFDYLTQALTKIVAQSAVLDLVDYDYDAGNCLYGVYLSKGGSQSLNAYFERNVSYVVLGAGDDDIIDLDLRLLSSSGTELIKDTRVNPIPILEFVPTSSGKMTLKITNYDSEEDGFCVMVVLRQSSSSSFSTTQLAQALDNVILNAQVAYLVSSRFATGTFCLFGGRLGQGKDTYLYNMRPTPGEYILVGAGSDNISDVDISVAQQTARNDPSGTIIAKDTAIDNHPFCAFTVYPNQYYLLRHKNYSSSGGSAGFVFSVLLQL